MFDQTPEEGLRSRVREYMDKLGLDNGKEKADE